ncbi:MAG: COX15/CtaA family protein [Caulobacteraceae bacterium]|nr:COX15/CtaA family protein [Caulobacteraceae bacterium]
MTSILRTDRSRPVAVWLFAVAFLVLCMVVVGGATRLTGSGLSITEWKPVTGVVPPLSKAAWREAFAKYQQIPQYRFVNRGMSLDAFKGIFWWEWTHRLLGRLLGVVFAVPFVIFLVNGRLPRRLIWRCVVLFILGGLQGTIGWLMVQTGLVPGNEVSVSPVALAAHLGGALILYSGLIWTALEAWAGAPRSSRQPRWALAAVLLVLMAFVQSLLGALVAGNHAGLVDNDWPLMDGQVFPSAYWSGGFWRSLLHSQAAVQFNHRLGAYCLLTAAVVLAFRALRTKELARQTSGLFLALGLMVAFQACLGVVTLMSRAPLGLSAGHQVGAALVLACAVTLAWRSQRA